MEVQVLERRENPLLQRVEVTFKVVHKAEPTPGRDALRAELARALKATKDIVIVDGAASTFGRYETHGYAKVYKTKEQALSVERRHLLVRNKLVEPEAKEAKEPKAGPPPKVEKPAPKKEEAKPEAKPEPKPEKAPPRAEKAPAKEEKKAAPTEKKAEKPEGKKAEKPEPKKAEPKKPEPKKKEGK
jgi:ribosomal protein S24E